MNNAEKKETFQQPFNSLFLSKSDDPRDILISYILEKITILSFLIGFLINVLIVLLLKKHQQKGIFQEKISNQIQKIEIETRKSSLLQMSSIYAHELNQPLLAIEAYAHGCIDKIKKKPQESKKLVVPTLIEIKSMVMRCNSIIKNIKNHQIYNLEKPKKINVSEAVLELNPLFSFLLSKRDVELLIEIKTDVIACVRKTDLQQIMINLIKNAAKAFENSNKKNKKIIIRADISKFNEIQGKSNFITLTVSDNATGIPETFLDDLFSPFKSLESEGMGLGLSICRTFIERNGGKIQAANNNIGGAEFILSLPKR